MESVSRDHNTDSRDPYFSKIFYLIELRNTLFTKGKNKILININIFKLYLELHALCLMYVLVYIYYDEGFLILMKHMVYLNEIVFFFKDR